MFAGPSRVLVHWFLLPSVPLPPLLSQWLLLSPDHSAFALSLLDPLAAASALGAASSDSVMFPGGGVFLLIPGSDTPLLLAHPSAGLRVGL